MPYLPIDPADLGRQYEPIVRINSQSGKGGAAFVMHQSFGYVLPKAMHPEFGKLVKKDCDEKGREISAQEVFDIFKNEYLDVHEPYDLISYKIFEEDGGDGKVIVDFESTTNLSATASTPPPGAPTPRRSHILSLSTRVRGCSASA